MSRGSGENRYVWDENMNAAMIGDNCIDVYVRINGEEVNRRYPTGNCVDTGVNLQKLGIPTAIISTTGSDENGTWMLDTLTAEGLDVSHLKIGDGQTAITYPYNYMIGSEAQREDAVNYLKLCLDMSKEMGAEFVLTSPANGGYLATYDQLWARLEKTIRELGDYAAKLEIKLTVEALTPYESNFFTRANDLVELFRRIDNPYVVGMCDVVPPFVQHESIMAYFDKLGSKMDHMHIIDGDNGTGSHIMPGEGSMPLQEMMHELKRIGYDGTATLELVTGYINEPRMYARRAVNNVRAMMAQASME